MHWLRRLLRTLRWWVFQARLKLMGDKTQTQTRSSSRKPAPPPATARSRAAAPTIKRAAARRPRTWWWWVKLALIVAGTGLVVGVAGLAGIFLYYGMDPDLPRIEKVGDYRPKVVSRVLDREGELLGEIFEERRTMVPPGKIPPVMVHAIVDAEDAQFYEHKGLNYWGMARAFVYNLRPGAHLQGASTITQQLVKNFLLKTNERTLKRKVQEMILARRLETRLSKDEILYLYLNQIEFGHGRFGIEEASRYYFGKSVSEVNAGEAAMLASLPKGPSEMDPWKHGERLKDRQRYVLSQMLRYGHISKGDAEYYATAPIQVVKAPPTVGSAPEFVDEARRQLIAKYGDKELPYLGVTVVTTCDARIERLAREALESNLEKLDERQGYRKAAGRLKAVTPEVVRASIEGKAGARDVSATIKAALDERAVKRLVQRLGGERPSRDDREDTLAARARALAQGKTTEAVVVEVRRGPDKGDKGDKGEAAGVLVDTGAERGFLPLPAQKDRYNPKALPVDKRFAVGDILWVRAEPSLGRTSDNLPILVPELGPQGAVMVVDPATREVRAMVGGYDFHAGGFNRATRAQRQPGSAFKPLLYALAFASQKYTPATVVNDSPQVYEQPGLAPWKPKNAESHEFLGPVRLRTALAKSLNTVASQLVFDLGAEPLAKLARDLGIESKLDANLSLGIGSSVVTLAEMTNAYTTLATGGRRAPLVSIARIAGEETKREAPVQAVTPEVAYLVTSLMESVIDEGTAASAKGKLKRPAAGKTGTTNAERDAWFMGYTPQLVAGVWVGFDDMRDLGHGEQGARSALPVWVDVMNGALRGVPPASFAVPPGIVIARIDPVTGLLAQPGDPNAIDEKFLQGTAPTAVAPPPGADNPDTFIMDQAQPAP